MFANARRHRDYSHIISQVESRGKAGRKISTLCGRSTGLALLKMDKHNWFSSKFSPLDNIDCKDKHRPPIPIQIQQNDNYVLFFNATAPNLADSATYTSFGILSFFPRSIVPYLDSLRNLVT